MKKIILLTLTGVLILFGVLSLRPVKVSPENCVVVTGTVSSITEECTKEH